MKEERMLTDRPFGSLIREERPTKDLWGILDNRYPKPITFDAIRIRLAPPEKIRNIWSSPLGLRPFFAA